MVRAHYVRNQAGTMGEISIEHVNVFLGMFISKDAIHQIFLPDIGINSSNPHMKRNRNIQVDK